MDVSLGVEEAEVCPIPVYREHTHKGEQAVLLFLEQTGQTQVLAHHWALIGVGLFASAAKPVCSDDLSDLFIRLIADRDRVVPIIQVDGLHAVCSVSVVWLS